MVRRLALLLLVVAICSIGAAYALAFLPSGGGRLSPLLMVFGIAGMAVGLMTLGAVREGERLGILGFAFAFVFAVIVGGFGLALFLADADGPATRLFLGLPPRAAIVVFGVGFLPVLVLPFVYARTFESRTLKPEDLERVKAARVENEAQRARDAGSGEGAGA